MKDIQTPTEYSPEERDAYIRGWLESKRSYMREQGRRGGYAKWEKVSLEERIRISKAMNEAKKRKRANKGSPTP